MSNPIIESIHLVSKSAEKKSQQKDSTAITEAFKRSPEGVSSLLDSMQSVARMVALQLGDIKEPAEHGLDLFESLGIQFDEIIHSNAIAKCFSDASPKVATALLIAILDCVGHHAEIKAANLAVYKERALGSLPNAGKIDSQIHGRRLDILVEHPQLAFVIENKIESKESAQQTKDYFSALQIAFGENKKIYGVLLSPDKTAPDCERFQAMSYVDLYRVLQKIVEEHKDERIGFLRLYAKEVFDIFVQQRRRSYFQTLNYWEGKTG